MRHIVPNYYPNFSCIQGACRHNCCIGWEIDIDEDTAETYHSCRGSLASRLQADIAFDDDPPHFILGPQERCPFLNQDNLCDIIIEMGEDRLCQICAEHPRFHNELPGRIESGLGLCCEAAGRLILGQQEPVTYRTSGDADEALAEDEVITYRDEVLHILQDRSLSMEARLARLELPVDFEILDWIPFLLHLEILDTEWSHRLAALQTHWRQIDWKGFNVHMKNRQIEYEQLLVYLIYRHMANAPSLEDADVRAAFAALGYRLIHALGAATFTLCGEFTFEDQVELARLFSSEIEYSEENLYALLDELEYENAY